MRDRIVMVYLFPSQISDFIEGKKILLVDNIFAFLIISRVA